MRINRWCLFSAFLAASLAHTEEIADLEVGDPLPDFEAIDANGRATRLSDFHGRVNLILFGELYNRNVVSALRGIDAILQEDSIDREKVHLIFVAGVREETQEIARELEAVGLECHAVLLHDREREGFELYDIRVIPSLVVADGKGKLVLKLSGYPINFGDVVRASVQFALGRLQRAEYERLLEPPKIKGQAEVRTRAIRVMRMAYQLRRRKLTKLAEERYREAIDLDPTLREAHVGLAHVLFVQNRITEAEAIYERVLHESPTYLPAHIGMARVEIQRGDLSRAESRIKEQLAQYPLEAELHYLLGTVYESKDEVKAALHEYKESTRLLLSEREQS